MLIDRARLHEAYRRVKQDALQSVGGCSVLILCGLSCDALCAASILAYALRTDHVCYKLRPATSYSDLSDVAQKELRGNEELRSVFLIGCGGIVDLEKWLGLEAHMSCFVIDPHRPTHLANVYADAQIQVFDDDFLDRRQYPSEGSDLSGVLSSGESSEDSSEAALSDSDDDAEAEFGAEAADTTTAAEEDDGDTQDETLADTLGDGAGARVGTASEASPSDGDDEAQDGDRAAPVDEDDLSLEEQRAREARLAEERGHLPAGSTGGAGADRRGASERGPAPEPDADEDEDEEDVRIVRKRKRSTAQATRSARRQRIREYYSGSYFGQAATASIYELVTQLNKDCNDLLWLNILGQTDHYMSGRIHQRDYHNFSAFLATEVAAKNADTETGLTTQDGTVVKVADTGRIRAEKAELRFMLYRHWSLYEAMFHSDYVCPRLQVWTTQGRARMEELLARMGISLTQARQKFGFMDPTLVSRLRAECRRYGPDYGLPDLFFQSFSRTYGYRQSVAAADVVCAVNALLEAGSQSVTSPNGAERSSFMQAFNDAMSCLTLKRPELLQRGLQLSMSLQQLVVKQAVQLMDAADVTHLRHFRYGHVRASGVGAGARQSGSADPTAHDAILAQPLALGKLARFLITLHTAQGRWRGPRAKPLLLLTDRPETYLVVAVVGTGADGELRKNHFGKFFQLAAEKVRARIKHDGFDTSVLEIRKEDWGRFVETLHFIMEG